MEIKRMNKEKGKNTGYGLRESISRLFTKEK